jgi:hypothetical protein
MTPKKTRRSAGRAAAEAAAKAGRAEAERKVQTDAQEIVAIWNGRQAGGLCGCRFPARLRAMGLS